VLRCPKCYAVIEGDKQVVADGGDVPDSVGGTCASLGGLSCRNLHVANQELLGGVVWQNWSCHRKHAQIGGWRGAHLRRSIHLRDQRSARADILTHAEEHRYPPTALEGVSA